MSFKLLNLVVLFLFAISCNTRLIEPIEKIENEELFGKNGNMICGSQGLILNSSEIVSNQNNDILNKGDNIDKNTSRYSCGKAQSKNDYCKINIYNKMDLETTIINRKLTDINAERKALEKKYFSIPPQQINIFDMFVEETDSEKTAKIISNDYKKNKEKSKIEIDKYNKIIDELKNKLSGC
ncbi:hypothetical protein [Spirobacillus cienkowskii]|jgi:hypothetical protein|uniref:Uncharacterized protein n=1 Tax=Spirobacillus cienkowskii TaxID=495820 RepID=A0A369L096_9BACT|nr:MAG: hypothetical protein DCC88_02855 [Spirobacillus cienkowskii]